MKQVAPVSSAERIKSIDVLRGFALLGILVMNIQVMGMIGASYSNPIAYGDFTGINYWVWYLSHLFFDQKMMTIFSMLFGAGIALMSEKAMSKTGSSTGLHYRRMFWLLLIGLIHAYLIWFGDILACYAICGMVFYWMRNWNPKLLLLIGLFLILVPSLLNVGFNALASYGGEEFRAEIEADWNPPPEKVQAELDAYRGSWLDQMTQRVPMAIIFETFLFAIWSFWRAGGLMLIGMAIFRWGVISGEKTNRFYLIGAFAGFAIAIPLIVYGVMQKWSHDWDGVHTMFVSSQFNYWGSLAMAMAYVCCIMLLVKNELLPGLVQSSLAAVGQMALTNYLLHSLMGTFIFYGHGLGWFGYVNRTGQFLIVLSIWIFQLVVSPLWLSRFRFGPFEWIWRSLTYWKFQPMIRDDLPVKKVSDQS